MKEDKRVDLYSCDFKNRKTFLSICEKLLPTSHFDDVVQLTIYEDGNVLGWELPCGNKGCVNFARCKK